MMAPVNEQVKKWLRDLRAVVQVEYEKKLAAIDTLINEPWPTPRSTQIEGTNKRATKPRQNRPEKRKAPKPGKSDGTMTLAEHMRQYVSENPGRDRKQVIDAMIYSNRSKNRDSVAAGLSVVIKQGDIEERDGKLYRAK